MGVFSPHTRLIVLFGEPNPQGFVLVPECRNLGWTDLQAKGMPCVSGAPCLAQGLIRHAWGASLTDVGLQGCGVKGYKASPWPKDPSTQGSHTRRRGQIRAGMAPKSGQ